MGYSDGSYGATRSWGGGGCGGCLVIVLVIVTAVVIAALAFGGMTGDLLGRILDAAMERAAGAPPDSEPPDS
ncbi:MAG: hypothetical protein AAFR52_19040 [Pseudomonadota bacterium]